MKKIIAVFFLFFIISTTFGFTYLKVSANGSEDNFFNAEWRSKFSKIYFLRQVIGLHYDGDAKNDYLGKEAEEIAIEVDSMEEAAKIDAGLLDELAEKIKNITGKKVSYFYSDSNISLSPFLKYEDLDNLERKHRDKKKERKRSALYLLIASRLEDNPMRLGSTLKDDGIVLFAGALSDLTDGNRSRNHAQVFDGIVVGTLLHEFGHQLGIPHNNEPDCLMNEQAEYSDRMKTRSVITDFCEYEKELIDKF